MFSTRAQVGQGTIEYLVILSVVIVIGLAIVALSADIMSVNSAQVGPSSGKLSNKIGVGGISITEAVTDSRGDGIISLANNSGGNFTLTKITPIDSKGNEGTANKFNSTMVQGSSRTFYLSDINTYCPCYPGDKTKTCSFELTITADTGVEKTLITDVTTECMSTITSTDLNRANQPVDCLLDENSCLGTNYLTCGSNNTWVNHGDTNGYCSYYPSCYFGQTSCSELNYLTCDNNYDWTNDGNVDGYCGYSYALFGCWSDLISPHPICNLSDLNKMRDHSDWSYTLQSDINAYPTRDWDSGAGFLPINDFSENFDGNGHTIIGLYIYRPTTDYVGFFSFLSDSASIENIGLVDINVTGANLVGGVAGWGGSATISNSYSTGKVNGTRDVGGITGWLSFGTISNSYTTVTVNSSLDRAGGISGYFFGTITNSYSTGNVSSGSILGGLVGYKSAGTISNSFATGTVTGIALKGGIAGFSLGTISNNFWYSPPGSTIRCHSNDTGCTKIIDANGGVAWFYYDTNLPMNDGNWTFGPDKNWNICRGSGYPWLSWENRTC